MGRPGRSRCDLCGMGKRAGITTVCRCGRNVCPRHSDTSGAELVCTKCARLAREEAKQSQGAGQLAGA
jgi:hypothetical protein